MSTLRDNGGLSVVSTHVSIYTLHIDGLRELYRQFLRLEDGSIIEVAAHCMHISITVCMLHITYQ